MILSFRRRFSPPSHLISHEQIRYCVSVIDRYRQELPHLRAATSTLMRQRGKVEEKVTHWKQRYEKERQEREKLERENGQLKQEIGKLEQEVEKLTKTTNRYQAALFDHGNFKSPLEDEGKQKGGQVGHLNTNREQREDPCDYERKRVFVSHCPDCNKRLHRVSGVRQKQLLDIILNPQAVRLIVESERQWCGNCKKEVNAKDERSLPFSEYGMNTFMMALLLRYRCLLPLLHRLREQHEGLVRSLIITPNGTNNFAEQELRPIALTRKISYGSDTYTDMETTAILASVVQTYARTKRETFFPSLAASLRAGFVNSRTVNSPIAFINY